VLHHPLHRDQALQVSAEGSLQTGISAGSAQSAMMRKVTVLPEFEAHGLHAARASLLSELHLADMDSTPNDYWPGMEVAYPPATISLNGNMTGSIEGIASVSVDRTLNGASGVESTFTTHKFILACLIGTGITLGITLLVIIGGIAVVMATKKPQEWQPAPTKEKARRGKYQLQRDAKSRQNEEDAGREEEKCEQHAGEEQDTWYEDLVFSGSAR